MSQVLQTNPLVEAQGHADIRDVAAATMPAVCLDGLCSIYGIVGQAVL